ncbi:MAG: DUF177 domain-containing protein [Bernardetiaceae bacterium]|jgi:uncharacterized metal-binding protein YceD (DUF177 family)|nr:DUF177 domain-containing protein [Bernardetiaceae bacterium]
MKDLRQFDIDIVALRDNRAYEFEYRIGDDFFTFFETDLVQSGQCTAKVELTKGVSMLTAKLHITGFIGLLCDRSLDPFDYPIEVHHTLYFKFGDVEGDDTDDVIMIARTTSTLNLAKYLYEFVGLEVPMKKLHPRYQTEPDADDVLVYSSSAEPEPETDAAGSLEDSLRQLQDKYKNRNKQ